MYYTKKANRNTRFKKVLFAGALILVLLVAIAAGEVGKEQVIASVGAVGTSQVESQADNGLIQSVLFPEDSDVRDALRVLRSMYKKNIVPSPKVEGPITITRLYDVTFEEAMEAILGYEFKYEVDGNFVRVYTAEEYKMVKEDTSRMIYKVFTLYYITSQEAVNLIAPVLSNNHKISSSTPAEKGISAGSLSASAGGTSSARGSSGSAAGNGDSMALNDTIVIYDYPENIIEAEKVIKALDIRPKQVLVEATILSATLTEGAKLGVDLNFMAGVSLTGTAATETVTAGDTVGQIGAAATSAMGQLGTGIATGTPIETSGFAAIGGSGLRLGITTGDVAAFITALETVTDVTVIANPKILAVNKQEGSVLIGRNLGYRQTSSLSSAGNEIEGEVKFLPTGTQLVFRPYIGNDGYIRMEIYPKDSVAELDSDGVPQETTTQLKTNIIVKDGQTIVIGGLFRDVVSTSRNQVPLLGDLPLIGALFRSTSDSSRREEVIIMLTTHIIDNPEDMPANARAEDISRKRAGAKDSLQWLSRTKLAEDNYERAIEFYLSGHGSMALHQLNTALELRPTYLEAIRLKEKIVAEAEPGEVANIKRNMIEAVEAEECNI